MGKRTLIWIIVSWIILTLLNFYLVPYFILAFEWLLMIGILFLITIIQIIKLIKERKDIKKQRIFSLIVITGLFLLTLYRDIPNLIIEKIDWIIFLNKRIEIIDQVKNNELAPNKNILVCELPYEFPIVSNGGNDIVISKNKTDSTVTIKFWIFRNFFDSPSTYYIYTEDLNVKERIENKISKFPRANWLIKNNWYRVYGEF